MCSVELPSVRGLSSCVGGEACSLQLPCLVCKDESPRRKLEPSMKWKVLEDSRSTEDELARDRDQPSRTAAGLKSADKQIRIKSSGRASSGRE